MARLNTQSKTLNPINIFLGTTLKAIRKQKKLLQRDVARITGMPIKRIQQYESGKKDIACGELYDLLNSLQINIHSFFGKHKYVEHKAINDSNSHHHSAELFTRYKK